MFNPFSHLLVEKSLSVRTKSFAVFILAMRPFFSQKRWRHRSFHYEIAVPDPFKTGCSFFTAKLMFFACFDQDRYRLFIRWLLSFDYLYIDG